MENNKTFFIMMSLLFVAVAVFAFSSITGTFSDSSQNVAAPGKSKPPNEPGSVWDDLKAKGLQGEHYTLNIHGKKSDFNKSDCTVTPDPVTGEYSNNIFVPSNSDGNEKNQIIMTSGNVKGKWASTNPVYGVRDACTAPFDGDAAEITLPANDKGYYVVARVLGKPTNNPDLNLQGDLLWVMDENGNDLLVLGLVTDDGFQTPSVTLTRTKGKTKAVDITGLFEWNGNVCYFATQDYCYDDMDQYICTDTQLCCTDANSDGVYESCTSVSVAPDNTIYCPVGSILLTLGCKEYVNEWVFNIGDFVGYMWDTHTGGDFKLANIRFYPVK